MPNNSASQIIAEIHWIDQKAQLSMCCTVDVPAGSTIDYAITTSGIKNSQHWLECMTSKVSYPVWRSSKACDPDDLLKENDKLQLLPRLVASPRKNFYKRKSIDQV